MLAKKFKFARQKNKCMQMEKKWVQPDDLLETDDDFDLNSIQKNKIIGSQFPQINLAEVAQFLPIIELSKNSKKSDKKLKHKEFLKKNENENSENVISNSTNRGKRNSSDSTAPIVKKLQEKSKNHEKFGSVKVHRKPAENREKKAVTIFNKAKSKGSKEEQLRSQETTTRPAIITENVPEITVQSKGNDPNTLSKEQESKLLIQKNSKLLLQSDSEKKGKSTNTTSRKGSRGDSSNCDQSLKSFDSKKLEMSSFDRKLVEEKRMLSSKDLNSKGLYSIDEQTTTKLTQSMPGTKPKDGAKAAKTKAMPSKKFNEKKQENPSDNSQKGLTGKNKKALNDKKSSKTYGKTQKNKLTKSDDSSNTESSQELKSDVAKNESFPQSMTSTEDENKNQNQPEAPLNQNNKEMPTFQKSLEILKGQLSGNTHESEKENPNVDDNDSYLAVTSQNKNVGPIQPNFIHRKPRKGGRRLPTILNA